jgi:hypothetical protein
MRQPRSLIFQGCRRLFAYLHVHGTFDTFKGFSLASLRPPLALLQTRVAGKATGGGRSILALIATYSSFAVTLWKRSARSRVKSLALGSTSNRSRLAGVATCVTISSPDSSNSLR